jgi:hypothetical protein
MSGLPPPFNLHPPSNTLSNAHFTPTCARNTPKTNQFQPQCKEKPEKPYTNRLKCYVNVNTMSKMSHFVFPPIAT